MRKVIHRPTRASLSAGFYRSGPPWYNLGRRVNHIPLPGNDIRKLGAFWAQGGRMGIRTAIPNPEAIDRFRVKKGWSLGELAEYAGLSPRTIDNVMAGKPALIGTLARIAKRLDVAVDQISDLPSLPPPNITYTVELKLREAFPGLTHEQYLKILGLISEITGGDIMDADTKEGSVIITLQLTEEQARRLWDYKMKAASKEGAPFSVSPEAAELMGRIEFTRWPAELPQIAMKTDLLQMTDAKSLNEAPKPKPFPKG
jgi:transcriptional regulator with XRE-family HTH domain